MDEEWVYVNDSNNRYKISNYGRIFSARTDREVKQFVRGDSQVHMIYLYLYEKPTRVVRSVARLVMEHFSERFDPSQIVNHIDGDPSNNSIENLSHSDRRLTRRTLRRWPKAHQVINNTTGVIYKSAREAAEAIGGHTSLVYACVRGDQDTHMGYSFSLYNEPVIVYNNRVFDDPKNPWGAPSENEFEEF